VSESIFKSAYLNKRKSKRGEIFCLLLHHSVYSSYHYFSFSSFRSNATCSQVNKGRAAAHKTKEGQTEGQATNGHRSSLYKRNLERKGGEIYLSYLSFFFFISFHFFF